MKAKHVVMKKLLAFMLALALAITLLPQTGQVAYAATNLSGLTDTTINLSYQEDSQGSWSAVGTEVTGSVAGVNFFFWRTKETTLTIKNARSTNATLVFDYEVLVNGGTIKIDGGQFNENGSFSKSLDAGKSISVYLESSKSKNATTIKLKNIKLVADATATTTFKKPEHGSYTVDGTAVTADTALTKSSQEAYALVATPDSGYKFLGWYDATGKCLSDEKNASLNIDVDTTITAKFTKEDNAIFSAAGQKFDDLSKACTYAQQNGADRVVLDESGSISGSHSIPAGITLLIPFDEAGTLYKEAPEAVQAEATQQMFRALTLEQGASIAVEGSISVGGKHFAASTPQCCKPTGDYGQIILQDGSAITLKNGSNLYAWGYITGTGTVTAKSGANVYEYFQITDWRGGNKTSGMINNSQKVFPFSQYYVQNIEAPLTIEDGAKETVYISVEVNIIIDKVVQSATIPFIGDGGLFRLEEGGSITKQYNPSKDRMQFTVDGTASINSIAMQVGTYNINSKNYVMPINNNIDFEILSGSMTVNNDLALLPGVTVKGDKGTTLRIASGAALYVYDTEQWSKDYMNAATELVKPVAFSPSGKGARGALTDAKVDVNGTMIAAGNIYTTAGGANICSSEGTGVYVQEGAVGTSTKTYQYNQSTEKYIEIPITAAKLSNADGSYTETAGAAVGDNISYKAGKWSFPEQTYTVTWINEDGTVLETDGEVTAGTVPTYDGETPSKEGDAQYSYTFKGWDPAVSAVTGDITYKATYTQNVNKYTITWKNYDGTTLKTEQVAYGQVPEYKGDTPVKTGTAQYEYVFSGWTPTVSAVTGNAAYTAVFTDNLKSYTVIWKNYDGTELQKDEKVPYGTEPTYKGKQPERKGDAQYRYTFKGWTPTVSTVTGDITYTAVFESTVNKYTVTWKNWDGSVLKTESVNYGQTPSWSGTNPTRETKDGYEYTFDGWTPALKQVTGDVTYTATFKGEKLYYTIKWVDEDGETVLETDSTVEYNATPSYDGKTPEKDADYDYTYTFAGWSPSPVAVTKDAVYTATYTKHPIIRHTITFDANGGEGKMSPQQFVQGEDTNIAENKFTREHYNFTGWNTQADGKGVSYADQGSIINLTEDMTLYAQWEAHTYTVTWVDEDGKTVLEKDENVAYGTMPTYDGKTPSKEGDAQYSYTFKGWDKEVSEVTGDVTYKAVYESSVNKYTVQWVDEDGKTVLEKDENVAYGTMPTYDGKTPSKEEDADNTYTFNGWSPAVSEVTGNVTYKATYKAEPIVRYTVSFDANGGAGEMEAQTVKAGTDVTLAANTFTRDHYAFAGWNTQADGKGTAYTDKATIEALGANVTLYAQWKIFNGLEHDGDDTYWVQNGERVLNAGLIQVKDEAGNNVYYYFAEDGKAVKNIPVGGQDYWVENTNELLPIWGYYFDENGIIIHDDQFQNGIHQDVDGKLYYYMDGIKVHKGMFLLDGEYYYAKSSGALITNASYYCTRNNGLKEEGTYSFDAEGKMIRGDKAKNGIVAEEGSLYYYVEGTRTYAGLIQIGDDYYYVRTNGEVVHGKAYWITKTNNLMPEQSYTFADDGKMIRGDKTKNGIVAEEGSLYYYVEGTRIYAGLIQIGDDYYYVRTNGEVVHGKSYWITKTNNLMPEQSYTFDDDGKMIRGDKTKNGIVAEDGSLYYYVEGTRTYAGIIEIDGSLYYVKSNGEVVHGKRYWITKTNGLLEEKSYTFADDGKIIL